MPVDLIDSWFPLLTTDGTDHTDVGSRPHEDREVVFATIDVIRGFPAHQQCFPDFETQSCGNRRQSRPPSLSANSYDGRAMLCGASVFGSDAL